MPERSRITSEYARAPSAGIFILIRTSHNALEVLDTLRERPPVRWARPVYGPYQLVAYATGSDEKELLAFAEALRSERSVAELDVRKCKELSGDTPLPPDAVALQECAVLLIKVDHHEMRERLVVDALRKTQGIVLARAVWGPTDIIAIAEASDPEAMRDLICDEVKLMKGVEANETLYCYPLP